MSSPNWIDLPDFDPPIVFEVRAVYRGFDGFFVIVCVDDEITAHHLFGFGVWAVNHARLAIANRKVAAALVLELIAPAVLASAFDLPRPGGIFPDNLLHLFGREVREIGWRFMQE